ncbi:MAG: VOC family protein [Deltaproteobacteria bacterium]|nr:MAG: VOC family protein [Deltaproteobacteria bacterium]
MADMLGRFVWHDLMTPDAEAAKAFYGEVVGWGIQLFEGGKEPYAMWTNADGPIGGVMVLPAEARAMGAPPHWMAYSATPDLAATVARAEALGARVFVPPTAIPTVGAFAVLADPQGAAFAAFTPEGDAPGGDGPEAVGQFSWHELMTSDPDAAWAFYSELFGWQKQEAMDMGDGGVYQIFAPADGGSFGGLMRKPDAMPMSAWLHYIKVADVGAAIATAQRLGGTLVNGPIPVPGGDLVAQLIDPQGAFFAVHGPGV